MALVNSHGIKINYPIILLSGIVLLTSALIVFLWVVKFIYGNYEFEEILPTKENLTFFNAEDDINAAILYSEYTENLLGKGKTWIRDNVDSWENFISTNNITYDVIDDQAIEMGELTKYNLLILPGSKSLSDLEIINIKKFIDNGNSVFATGGISTYSDEGKWKGWDFFSEVFGLKFNKELDIDESFKIHTLRGNLPITAQIPSGFGLKVATWDRPIKAEIVEPRVKQASFWFDYRLESGLMMEEIKKSSGISYGTYGKGRFVWFGFEVNSVIGEQTIHLNFEKLMKNCFNWLTYRPSVNLKTWPFNQKGAAIFTIVLNSEATNISGLKKILNNNKYPVDFLIKPETLINGNSYIKSLKAFGNFTPIIDLKKYYVKNSDDEYDLQYEDLIYDLNSTKNLFYQKLNVTIDGFVPVNNRGGKKINKVLSEENFDYLITDSSSDRSVPRIITIDEKLAVVIPQTARDDSTVIKNFGLENIDFQKYTYKEDIDRIGFDGGLFVFRIHDDLQVKSEYAGVINDIYDYLIKKGFKITSIDELKNWWMQKSGIEIKCEARSKRRLALEVSNASQLTAKNIVIQIYINKQFENVKVTSDKIYENIPEFESNTDSQTLFLFVKDLGPNDTRSLFIDFDNVTS